MRVQAAQNVFVSTFNMIKSENCYNCHQLNHQIKSCSKILKLINDDLIHFNERKKMCFNKEKQKNVKMRLMYKLFKTEIVCVCLQQQTKIQNITIKINVIKIIEKLFEFENEINNEKKVHDENILMKVRAARQKINLFRRKVF